MTPVLPPDAFLNAVAEDVPALPCLLHPPALYHISFPLLTLLLAEAVTKSITITDGCRFPVDHKHLLLLSLPVPALSSICPSETTSIQHIHVGPSGITIYGCRPLQPQVS